MIHNSHSQCKRQGFTLIETLIVLMISGVLLASATSLLVNFTILRAKPIEAVEFSAHVKGLTDFLTDALNGDALPLAYKMQQADDTEAATVRLDRFPEESNLRPPSIEFDLPGDHPLCDGTEEYGQMVRAHLEFSEQNGLYLYWYIESTDPREPEGADYHRLLSPWVQAIRYAYYDDTLELWEIESALRSDTAQAGSYELPDCLLFDFQESEEKAIISIPIYLPGAEVTIDA